MHAVADKLCQPCSSLVGITLLSLMVDLVARGGEPLYGLFFIALVLVYHHFFNLVLNHLLY